MPIHFGTDGWRAVISDTFTFQNLQQVTQAIADAVASGSWINGNGASTGLSPDPHKMVVGFDTRFLSDRFAQEAGACAGRQRIHGLPEHGGCAYPGHFLRGAQPECHSRDDDHRLAQRPALQRGQNQVCLRRVVFAGAVPPGGGLPER